MQFFRAGFGNFTAILLFPLFMYYCRLGVYGAAISTVVSQYVFVQASNWLLFPLVTLNLSCSLCFS